MSYLLDTCLVSDAISKQPNPGADQWLATANPEETYLSVVTVAEIRRGIERLKESKRKQQLREWLVQTLLAKGGNRLLPVDFGVAETWGYLKARLDDQGRPMAVQDAWIAATALTHDLVVVTRNVKDFMDSGVKLLNPWT